MPTENKFGLNPNDPELTEMRLAGSIMRGMLEETDDKEVIGKTMALADALFDEIVAQDIGEYTLAAILIALGRVISTKE